MPCNLFVDELTYDFGHMPSCTATYQLNKWTGGLDFCLSLFSASMRCVYEQPCADPESFVRGGPTYFLFLLV